MLTHRSSRLQPAGASGGLLVSAVQTSELHRVVACTVGNSIWHWIGSAETKLNAAERGGGGGVAGLNRVYLAAGCRVLTDPLRWLVWGGWAGLGWAPGWLGLGWGWVLGWAWGGLGWAKLGSPSWLHFYRMVCCGSWNCVFPYAKLIFSVMYQADIHKE